MPLKATQDGRVMVESSDKMWSTGEGNGKPLQYSCLENPMDRMKRQNDMTLKWFAIPFSILSELSTMTRPSWVALHGMAHSFIELDKAMVHVIRLVSFPLSQSLPSGSFHQPLILLHQRADRLKTTITEN